MHTVTFESDYVNVTVTAHSDGSQRLLMARMTASRQEDMEHRPVEIALVIDRSGSMSGVKLQTALEASARLVRALSPRDRVAVVAYDHEVDVISPLQPPSERLAQRILCINSRGNTNLYRGWVTGAKLLNASGRVALLSDGLANNGDYTDARSLGHHAELTYKRYQKATTTIGIGSDYDEELMSEMARKGGGGHYFAPNADSIMRAFSQEQLSMDTLYLEDAELTYQSKVHSVGSFWSEEIKTKVFPVNDLAGKFVLTFRVKKSGKTVSLQLPMPDSFGHSDEVTLEYLIDQVSQKEMEMIRVRCRESAEKMYESVRALNLQLLAHPLADSETAQAVIASVEGTLRQLRRLMREYDESEATLHRKRSLQKSFNLIHRAQSYSSYDDHEDALSAKVLGEAYRLSGIDTNMMDSLEVDPNGLKMASISQWRAWRAVPIVFKNVGGLMVMENPRDGILQREISKTVGRRMQAVKEFANPDVIDRLLDELERLDES